MIVIVSLFFDGTVAADGDDHRALRASAPSSSPG